MLHEMKFFNGILETPDEAVERHRRHRRPAQPHQLPVGLGPGRQHAVQVVQAEHPRGRRPRAADRALADRHRAGPAAAARDQFVNVDRHRADDLRAPRRRPPPAVYRGHRAAAGHRPLVRHRPRRSRRSADQHAAVLRDGGQPGARRRRVEGGAASTQAGADYDTEPWELYHLADDRSECHDLADERARPSSPSWSRCGGPRPTGTACCRSTTA